MVQPEDEVDDIEILIRELKIEDPNSWSATPQESENNKDGSNQEKDTETLIQELEAYENEFGRKKPREDNNASTPHRHNTDGKNPDGRGTRASRVVDRRPETNAVESPGEHLLEPRREVTPFRENSSTESPTPKPIIDILKGRSEPSGNSIADEPLAKDSSQNPPSVQDKTPDAGDSVTKPVGDNAPATASEKIVAKDSAAQDNSKPISQLPDPVQNETISGLRNEPRPNGSPNTENESDESLESPTDAGDNHEHKQGELRISLFS
jgi:hypothetical protein